MNTQGVRNVAAWFFLAAVACAGSITLMQSLLAAAGLLWAIARRRGNTGPPQPTREAARLLLALAACSCLSALLCPEPRRALWTCGEALAWATVPMAGELLDARKRRMARSLLLLQAAGLGAWAVLEFLFWWDGNPLVRVRGPYSHHMTLAGVLLICTLQALPDPDLSARHARRRRRQGEMAPASLGPGFWAGVVCVLLGAAGLAATLTRSAIFSAAAGAAVLLGLSARLSSGARRRRAVIAFTCLGAGLVLAVLVPRFAAQRAPELPAAARASVSARLQLWHAGVKMVATHPLLGVGPGRVRQEVEGYLARGSFPSGVPLHLHSAPLTLAAERGLPALGLWIAIYAGAFRRLAAVLGQGSGEPGRAATGGAIREAIGPAAAVVAFLVMGLFEDNFGDAEVAFVHFVTLSALLVSTAPLRERMTGMVDICGTRPVGEGSRPIPPG